MPWETRKGKGRYYTRSTRVDGKVVRIYVGKKALAYQISEGVEYRKAARAARRAEDKQKKNEPVDELDVIVDNFLDQTADIMRATLENAGCHRHQRGEWRKRRGPNLVKSTKVDDRSR